MKKLPHFNRSTQLSVWGKISHFLSVFTRVLLCLIVTSAGLKGILDELRPAITGLAFIFLSTLVAVTIRAAYECYIGPDSCPAGAISVKIYTVLGGLCMLIAAHAVFAIMREPLTADLCRQLTEMFREVSADKLSGLVERLHASACIVLDSNAEEPYCSLWVALSVFCAAVTIAETAFDLALRQISRRAHWYEPC